MTKTQNNNNDFRRRFWQLTWINIMANLTEPLSGLIDSAMLGHLANLDHLAGVALATIVFDYLFWGLTFLRMGQTALVARDTDDIKNLTNSLVHVYRYAGIAFLLALTILVFQTPIKALSFSFLKGTPDVLNAAAEYYDTRIWGALAVLGNYVLIGFFLGIEKSSWVLILTICGNLGNVLLDYVFIMKYGWGASGAGLATAFSQYFQFLIGLALFLFIKGKQKSFQKVFIVSELVSVLKLNINLSIRTLGLLTGFAIFINYSSSMGRDTLICNSLLLHLVTLCAYLTDGPCMAIEVLISKLWNSSAFNSKQTLLLILKHAFLSAFMINIAFLLGFYLFSDHILSLLTSHQNIIYQMSQWTGYMFPYLLIGSAAFVLDGIYVGMAWGGPMRNSMILSTFVVFIPLAYIAKIKHDNQLLWVAMILFIVMRTVTLSHPFYIKIKSHLS